MFSPRWRGGKLWDLLVSHYVAVPASLVASFSFHGAGASNAFEGISFGLKHGDS